MLLPVLMLFASFAVATLLSLLGAYFGGQLGAAAGMAAGILLGFLAMAGRVGR